MLDYNGRKEMLEAFDEAYIVDYPCPETEDEAWDTEPWDLLDDEGDWDLEVGYDPYMGDYSWDC